MSLAGCKFSLDVDKEGKAKINKKNAKFPLIHVSEYETSNIQYQTLSDHVQEKNGFSREIEKKLIYLVLPRLQKKKSGRL